jgi:hypothetical protein
MENNYQEVPGATQSQERLQQMEANNITTTHDEMSQQRERVMFEKHVQEQGEPIPANFKSAGDWFDSLKEAQGNYTRGQQEMAALKTQYEEGGVANPDYDPNLGQEQNIAEPQETVLTGDEELRLNIPKEEPPKEMPTQVTKELWNEWTSEFTVKGEMTEETMAEIMNATRLPREVVEDYLVATKAKMRESFGEAATVVGGKENLKQIFDWAEQNLSPAQQEQINQGLSSPSYEVTLRGLQSMYNERSVAVAKGSEPSTTPNLQQVAASDTGFKGYATKREFIADRNNPRFKLEPQFREAVETRIRLTDFNTLPA